MTTTDIFRKIFQDLKEEFTKENNKSFLKEYTIPSINYQENSNGVSDLYFTSGIEMELDRMMKFFENKVFYMSYKDKYIFSNNEEKLGQGREKAKEFLEQNPDILAEIEAKVREKIASKNKPQQETENKEEK